MEFKVLMLAGSQLTVNVADGDEIGGKSAAATSAAPVPDEIQLAPLGNFADDDGNAFTVTPEAIAAIIAGFSAKVNDVPVDYEHQTLSGGKAPAAGWITALVNKGADGLWGKVKWTPDAAKHLACREYRYLSPVLLANKKDGAGRYVPSRLHSAALTNTPKIDGMVPIVNKSENPALLLPLERGGTGGVREKTTQFQEDSMLKKIRGLLGLPESATDQQLEETVIALKERPAVAAELAEALGLKPDAGASEAKATVLAMKQNTATQTDAAARLAALEKNIAARDAEEAVTLAMKEGKITEAQKLWAEDYALKDLGGFKMFAAKAVAVVPMQKADSQSAAQGDPAKGMTEEVKLIAKMMGNTEEKILKFGGLN